MDPGIRSSAIKSLPKREKKCAEKCALISFREAFLMSDGRWELGRAAGKRCSKSFADEIVYGLTNTFIYSITPVYFFLLSIVMTNWEKALLMVKISDERLGTPTVHPFFL